jgi:hypothetical protein
VLPGIDVRQVDHKAIRIRQRDDPVFDFAIQADLGPRAGRAGIDPQIIDFGGVRKIPAQRGEQRQAENELLDGDPLGAHAA